VDGAIERQKNLSSRRPLTRETSTGRPTKVGAAIRSRLLAERRVGSWSESFGFRIRGASPGSLVLGRKPRHQTRRKQSCTSGRPPVRYCGVRAAVVVLAGRIGCRSRQAARGHSRPCAKSAWTTRDGLAPRRESASGVKERRKPARPWQNGENGGGLSTKSEMAGRESAPQGAPVDGRRLGPNQVVRFDERTMEAVLVLVGSGKPDPAVRESALTRGRQEASEVRRAASSEKTTLRWGGYPNREPRRLEPRERARRSTVCDGRKLVPRRQVRGQPGSDCRKMVRRHAGRTLVTIRGLGLGSGERERLRGRRDASRALGNRAIFGCSYRESIAEVGEKHLFRSSKGSREANRGGAG